MGDDVKPDVMTLAKALGGGLPIGAMLVGEKAAETLQFGSHGSTFGGNPVMAAVALKSLELLSEEDIRSNVAAREAQLRDGLEKLNAKYGCFAEIRGRGLMIGAQLTEQYAGKAGDISELARQHGVLVLVAGPDVCRFLPPLSITQAELVQGLERFEKALAAFLAG
jgi:acetylornithine/N-succinyldiaminopimelate aminotransferase